MVRPINNTASGQFLSKMVRNAEREAELRLEARVASYRPIPGKTLPTKMPLQSVTVRRSTRLPSGVRMSSSLWK